MNLVSEDLDTAAHSLDLLCNELQNYIKVEMTVVKKIVNILTELLSDSKNVLHEALVANVFRVLEILARHYEASSILTFNEPFMKSIVAYASSSIDNEVSLKAASILLILSQDLSGQSGFALLEAYTVI